MKCASCNRIAELAVCEWPTPQFVMETYGDLRLDDLVTGALGNWQDAPAKVAGISRIDDAWREIVLDIRTGVKAKRLKTITVMTGSPVRVERMAACGALCCERHRVDRGGPVYCLDHSRAWEMVA